MADDDILIRLRAQADTAELKQYVSELTKVGEAAKKSGASEAGIQALVADRYRATATSAQRAGQSVRQYITAVIQAGNAANQHAAAQQKSNTAVEQGTAAHTKHAGVVGHVTKELGAMAAGYTAVHRIVHTLVDSFEEFAKFDQELRKMQNNLGTTRAEVDKLVPTFNRLAQVSGKSREEIIEGFEELREHAGLTLKQTEELFPAIVTGAQAAGTSAKVMADAFASMMQNMGVGAKDAGRVMDQLAFAQAHLRLNMAEMIPMMPRLTEAFGEMGYTGEQGNAAMLAWVSSLRSVTKNSAEAGRAAAMMMEQVAGSGMAHALHMPQLELERIVEMAKNSGQDVMSVITGMLLDRAQFTGKSVNQLLDQMGARERRYWRAAVENREEVRHKQEELTNSADGASMRMAETFRRGPQKAIDDLVRGWEHFKASLGSVGQSIGVTKVLDELAKTLDSIARTMDAIVSGKFGRKPGNPFTMGDDKLRDAFESRRGQARMDDAFKQLGYGSDYPSTPDSATLEAFKRSALPRAPAYAQPHAPSEGIPPWVPPQYRGSYHSGWEGGAQHFASGDFSGGTGAGRNWQHNLLSGSPMSGNIEDRRLTERNTDVTQANTEAMQRLTDLLDDVEGVRGGLAAQLGIGSIGGGSGRFGGMSGGRAGGGTGSGGVGGVAGAGSGGPGMGMGGSGRGGTGGFGGGGEIGDAGTGPATGGAGASIYNKLRSAYEKSGLVGTIPPGGEKFGFKTGSADEWARFGTGVAKAESNFNPRDQNLSDPGGSFGIMQYAHNQVPGGNAFDVDASIAAFVRDSKTSVESGHGLNPGGILGRRFSTIGNHPERTIRQLGKGYTTDGSGAAVGGGGGEGNASDTSLLAQRFVDQGENQRKDELAAKRVGMDVGKYRVEGMHPEARASMAQAVRDFESQTGGKAAFTAGFRDDFRQEIATGYKARTGFSQHGGSQVLPSGGLFSGGMSAFGQGKAMDVPRGPFREWMRQFGARYGFRGIPHDEPHLQFQGNAQTRALLARAQQQMDSQNATKQGNAAIAKGIASGGGQKAEDRDDSSQAVDKAIMTSGGHTPAQSGQAAAGDMPGKDAYGPEGFGKSHFGAQHDTTVHERSDGPYGVKGFGRSHFGARHDAGGDKAAGKGDRGEHLDKASGKGRERATGSPAGMPQQARSVNVNYNMERAQFARRDRQYDLAAKTALLQASENAHSDHGVA
jgi:TP901 family phage tail tape measure protein